MQLRRPQLSSSLLAGGLFLFSAGLVFNYGFNNAFYGDFCEWVGTAGLVVGACLVIRSLSSNVYVTRFFYTASAFLVLARFLDFTEDFPLLERTPFFDGGPAHLLVLRLSESFGYICILLTMLAALYELNRMKAETEDEHKRYLHAHEASLFLARVADVAPEAVIGADRDQRVRSWNLAAGDLFGYTSAEAAGMKLNSFFTNDVSDLVLDPSHPNHPMHSIHDLEVTGRTRAGRLFPAAVSVSPVVEENGRLVGVSIIVHDIEARKKAEQELVASRNLLAGALRNADVGFAIVIPDGDAPLEYNRRMEQLIGLTREEIENLTLAKACEAVFEEPVRFYETVRQTVIDKGVAIEFRNLNVHRTDGKRRVCNMTVSPVFGEDGKLLAAAIVAVDITEREALQAKLLESQKLESVGRLAGGVAHDFNNILSGILGFASLMRQQLEPDSPFRHYVEAIEQSSNRASELIHQLLAFAKGGKHKIQSVDLTSVARETLALLSRTLKPNILVTMESDPHLHTVSADSSQMQQLLMNLCINSRDAVGESGEIHILLKNVEIDEAAMKQLGLKAAGPHVCITVRDNGCGIPAEVSQHIFEPFFSTKEQGSGYGLGLSVVYGIVDVHRGALQVLSEPGNGAQFDIYLPATGQPAQRSSSNGLQTEALPSGSETVLVVDDEQLIRALLHEALTMAGYKVIEANNGEQAVSVYRARQKEVAVVILDLIMPGMGGVDAFNRIREINPNVRCIVSSGYAAGDINSQSLAGPYVRFVPKPYQASALLASVRELLDA